MSIFTTRRRAGAAGLVALAVAGTAGLAGGHEARADATADGQYTVVARADAFAVEYVNSGAPATPSGQIFYGTPSTAQSLIDGLERSEAFASAPFPGDLGAGSLSNANGLLVSSGLPGVMPAYPFIVSSTYPGTPSAHQEQGAYRIHAESDQHRSASDARTGLAAGDYVTALAAQASSQAALDTTTGTLAAVADSRLDGFKVTDALQLGKSTAHAEIARTPGQPIVKGSSFTIATIVVAGTEIGLTDKGFTLGDKAAPMADLSALFGILKQAGITLEYLPATGTESSIESAGLRISHEITPPGGPTQRLKIILGRVSTAIEGSATPASDGLLPGLETADSSSQPTAGAGLDASDTSTSDPDVAVGLSTTDDIGSFQAPSDPASAPAVGDTPATAGSPVPQEIASPAMVRGQLPDDDLGGLYLALVAAAGLSFAASRVRVGRRSSLQAPT